jgi:soluble lytic murein transglycosylase-like protein
MVHIKVSAANTTPSLYSSKQIDNFITAANDKTITATPTPQITQNVSNDINKELTPTPETTNNKNNDVSNFFALLNEKKQELSETAVEAKEPECKISSIFTPEVQQWGNDICRWSKDYNTDPDLIATVMQIESCGNASAVSFTGVPGLFQVAGENLDGENGFDPEISAKKGIGKVLKYELDSANGNITAALAGYNGGAIAREYINGNMSRNQLYSNLRNSRSGFWRTANKAWAKINEIEWYAHWANIYFDAKGGRTDTLQEWLNLGGARLCPSTQS